MKPLILLKNSRAWLLWPVSLALLAWVLRSVSLAETWAVLRQLSWLQLGLFAGANIMALLVFNGRWWLILRGLGYPLPYLTLARYRLAVFGWSYFTPGPQFGGEPLQVILVTRRHQVPRTTAVAAVTLDKSLELLVNFSFLVVGMGVTWHSQVWGSGRSAVSGIVLVFLSLLLLLPLTFLLALWRGWQPLTRISHWISRIPGWQSRPRWLLAYDKIKNVVTTSEKRAATFCQQQPGLLALALGVSLVSWGVLIGEYGFMLTLLGLRLSLAQLIIVLTAVRLAFLFPLPGGLGALEAGQVFALSLWGVDAAVGISASLLIRLRDVILGGIGLWWSSWLLNKQ